MASVSLLALIHPSAWKRNSPKSAYSIVLRTSPQNRNARSLAHPHSMTDPYMLGLGSIYGIEYAPLPLKLIPTRKYCNPYCNRADTHWYTMDKPIPPDRRKSRKQANSRTHRYRLVRTQANS